MCDEQQDIQLRIGITYHRLPFQQFLQPLPPTPISHRPLARLLRQLFVIKDDILRPSRPLLTSYSVVSRY